MRKIIFHMLPVLEEDRSSWEQTKLALIAKDHYSFDPFLLQFANEPDGAWNVSSDRERYWSQSVLL